MYVQLNDKRQTFLASTLLREWNIGRNDSGKFKQCLTITGRQYSYVVLWPCVVNPGSHQRHKHKHKIDTKTKYNLSSRTWKIQNNENLFLFRLLFCSWLMLRLCSYAYAYGASVNQALVLLIRQYHVQLFKFYVHNSQEKEKFLSKRSCTHV